jgi:two-component system nitrogen regulation response regulator NtrX
VVQVDDGTKPQAIVRGFEWAEMETILVVDDEPTILGLCQRILQLGGYNVLPAGGGDDALRKIQSSAAEIDLALVDVMMPGMNGVELAHRIQRAHPTTPIVLMTGYSLNEIARVVGDNNPYRIIWKPFKADSLLRMIENALGSSTGTSV